MFKGGHHCIQKGVISGIIIVVITLTHEMWVEGQWCIGNIWINRYKIACWEEHWIKN
jgi:hypothetical protein